MGVPLATKIATDSWHWHLTCISCCWVCSVKIQVETNCGLWYFTHYIQYVGGSGTWYILVGGYIQVWTGRHVRVGLAICIALIENFRLISFNLNSIFESINYLMIYFRLNVSSDHLGPKNWNVELFKSFRYANLRKYSNICGTLNAT